jgi:adenine-specific DNA methylase
MNTKFAKKDLDPTKKYKISAGQWAVFLEQRSSPDFKEEMANYFKEKAKKEFKGLMSEMLSNPPPELM